MQPSAGLLVAYCLSDGSHNKAPCLTKLGPSACAVPGPVVEGSNWPFPYHCALGYKGVIPSSATEVDGAMDMQQHDWNRF